MAADDLNRKAAQAGAKAEQELQSRLRKEREREESRTFSSVEKILHTFAAKGYTQSKVMYSGMGELTRFEKPPHTFILADGMGHDGYTLYRAISGTVDDVIAAIPYSAILCGQVTDNRAAFLLSCSCSQRGFCGTTPAHHVTP